MYFIKMEIPDLYPEKSKAGSSFESDTFAQLLLADDQRSWLCAPEWLKHASGEMAIILAGGPESFVEGHAHQVFADHRLHLVSFFSLKFLTLWTQRNQFCYITQESLGKQV